MKKIKKTPDPIHSFYQENDGPSAGSRSDDAVLGRWLRGSTWNVRSVVGTRVRMVFDGRVEVNDILVECWVWDT